MRINDMFTGVILAILSILLYRYAQTLPKLSGMDYGPGTFPSLIACGLFIGSLGLMLSGFTQYRNQKAQASSDPTAGSNRHHFLYALSVPAAIIFYMVASPWLGFSLTCFLIVCAMVRWLSHRWLLSIIVAACTTAVMWFVFVKALYVPLPTFYF